MNIVKRFLRDERGIESVEWALILGIIVLTAVMAAITAKGHMSTIFGEMASDLAEAAK